MLVFLCAKIFKWITTLTNPNSLHNSIQNIEEEEKFLRIILAVKNLWLVYEKLERMFI